MDGMQISTIMENLLFPEVEYFIIFQIFANIYTLWRIMMWFDGILEGKKKDNIIYYFMFHPGVISYYKCCFPRITILNSISWEERERRERVTKNWLNELFSISSKTNNSTMIFKQPNIFISSVSPLSSSHTVKTGREVFMFKNGLLFRGYKEEIVSKCWDKDQTLSIGAASPDKL